MYIDSARVIHRRSRALPIDHFIYTIEYVSIVLEHVENTQSLACIPSPVDDELEKLALHVCVCAKEYSHTAPKRTKPRVNIKQHRPFVFVYSEEIVNTIETTAN